MIESTLLGSPTISFFFQKQTDHDSMIQQLTYPGKIARHKVHDIIQTNRVSGICCLYYGYVSVSDNIGQVRFPRRHTKNEINLLITPTIEPVSLFENTIKHWKLAEGSPAHMYLMREQLDETSNQYVWIITKASLPTDGIIPVDTIVIIAKPRDIIIPSEISPTKQTANLVLPTLYVKQGINVVSHSAYFLNIRHLFRPVTFKTEQTPLRITTIIAD
jgi:hypothetical protein